jgi:hypothetical protein
LNNAVEAGNRIMMNIANISMHGAKRDAHSRLHREALKGSTDIVVGPGLDWKNGDEIALASTTFRGDSSEKLTVAAYDKQTGMLTTTTPLQFYHWGQAESTIDEYGADLRGEVIMLTRNILIGGDECTILSSDYIEADLSTRSGRTIMDGVQIKDCSQPNTEKAALRFDSNNKAWSSVSNSAFDTGEGWAVNINAAANIQFNNNVVFKYRNFGINI